MKINFGCGKRVLPGFYNIDAVPRGQDLDLIYAMEFNSRNELVRKMPIEAGRANYLQAMHVIEHFYRWEAPLVLAEFKRVLKDGGQLVLELPDLEKACRNFLKGEKDQMCMWPLYGDPGHEDPYMCHRWGYSPQSMKMMLKEAGFRNIVFMPPQTHGRRINRDMRVECVK